MNFVTRARISLIQIGKVAPFVVCFIVGISYVEDVYMLSFDKYIEFCDGVYLEKPISWFIGNYFKYDIVTILMLVVLSFAIETCIFNKMACAYLGINLAEKSYFDFEMDVWLIYAICLANIVIASYLTFKGLVIVTKSKI